MKRLTMVLVFIALGAAVAGGYWYWQQSQQSASDGAKAKGKGAKGAKGGRGGPLTVKAARAVVKPMPVLIEAVGTVEAEQSVQVRAQVSGVLQSVAFREGDKVKAGQLLFQIDPRTFQAQYNQAVAALARDRAQLENARAQEQRMEPLLKREFITRQEYDVAVTSAKSLEAVVQAGQAAVEQARIQLEFSRIVAPISGRTGQLAVKPGNLVVASGGGVPLVTINSTDPVLVGFSIPERQLEELRRYQGEKDIRIEILPDRAGLPAAIGKLVFIDNTVTPQTGTVLLKTRVDNTKELIWPGQFVNVRLVLTVEPEAVVVPEVAVQPGQDGPFVYLIGAEDKVEVRPVKVARQVGGEIVIASGVKGGDHVITEIPQALRPGGTVKVSDGTESAEPRKGKGGKKGEGKGGKKGEGKSDGKTEGGKADTKAAPK
ncbi:MAG: efflux RND transporter periplasmic adaptor subunit [Betaproteobacteria bacterium]|jgi:multidrug efflux system membrane fusion protein|nr:efflux RND transporter periplasmic adaptor subunit [Betaproteobacteria bacterium]MDH5341992.1 efflux RND transporter periplasmic adaptor subunit [Betaproteobacteria bacterium]